MPRVTEAPTTRGYTVLARKYRPRRFSDLIGQPHVVQALSNAMATQRVAQAFLLTGSRGTGKTTTARLLASALNCLAEKRDGIEPCGECPSCLEITRGEDLDVIEMDAASNSRVDDIRQRLESIDTRPARGKYRIYIIDEVHMLSASAFNALLKTVEEPPAHVKFILATTNPEKIPETILSRCQRYDFRRVTLAEMTQRLEEICATEKLAPGPGVLRMLSEMAEGGMRDALSRLDQLVAFAGEKATAEDAERVFGLVGRKRLMALLEQLSNGDAKAGILFAEQVFDSGKDVAEVLAALVALTRQLLMVQASGGDSAGIDVASDELPELKRVAARFGLTGLVYLAELLTECRQRVRRAAFPRVVVETTFVKLAMLKNLESLEQLAARLNEAADAPLAVHEVTPSRVEKLKDESPAAPAHNVSNIETPIPADTVPTGAAKARPATDAEHKALAELKKKFRAK
ncbi:DNA polymerase III subunit gamma/tau [Planctomycetaceae bacterium]|nr:DNA polymerase III subunit gamma/tau [Planctomycetaceae bacterium]